MEATSLTIPILVGAALVDSINPCAFGVLIFLLTYLFKSIKDRRRIFVHGMAYITGVFLTYLIAGLILLPVLQQFGRTASAVYLVLAVCLIIFGLLEIKDFFWYGKGPSLAILPSAARRIEYYTQKVTNNLAVSFFLGIFVALVELPCTGAVYLGVLALISITGIQINTLALLIAYNIIFVLPLIVILFFAFQGMQAEALEALRKKYRRHMRLAIGLVLVGMGWWTFKLTL
jgi:cytochrome c biogenesis protein CcdA